MAAKLIVLLACGVSILGAVTLLLTTKLTLADFSKSLVLLVPGLYFFSAWILGREIQLLGAALSRNDWAVLRATTGLFGLLMVSASFLFMSGYWSWK